VLLSKSQVEWIEDDKQDDKLSIDENESDKLLHFHPNGNQLIISHIIYLKIDNSLTTSVSSSDLLRYLSHLSVSPILLHLDNNPSSNDDQEELKDGESQVRS